ncbi:MAG: winged helix-turn-helix domain-containing protein [Aquincola sp.]|nr:winged helix-turn-helix domain-containing protein [Aquincola sp.]
MIVGKNPRQLNFGPALWTVPVVGDLIAKQFSVRLHDTTVWRLLHRMG